MTTRQEVSQEICFLGSNKREPPLRIWEAHNGIDMNKKELEERIKGLEHVIRVYKEEDIEISVDIYERLDQYQGELLKAQGEEKSGKISKANGNK